ncbi:proline iminopeptidase-family hydrolase [Kaarinaea lacus]
MKIAKKIQEGRIDVSGGKIWYQLIGEGLKTPLITLHGGPGFPHNSLRPLAALSDERPVVFYDQLGCGKSDRPGDKSLWNISRFVEELSKLINKLGFKEVNIFGHSWGSILALEYYLAHPEGIRKIIFASPVFSATRWQQDGSLLVQALPRKHQEVIAAQDTGKPYKEEDFKSAEAEYNRRHLCRLNPWPKDLKQSVAGLGLSVYHLMWGYCEWKPSGILKSYERVEKLKEIEIPVLITCGRYDNPTPDTTAYYQKQIKDAKIKVFENSSHAAFLEDQDEYINTIRNFLT